MTKLLSILQLLAGKLVYFTPSSHDHTFLKYVKNVFSKNVFLLFDLGNMCTVLSEVDEMTGVTCTVITVLYLTQ